MTGRIITVIGKRWFERVNGNIYHSATVYVDGECIGRVPFTYGYGSHYTQTALTLLQKAGYYTDASHGASLWRVVQDNGDKLIDDVTDVRRKKDL